MVAVCLVISTSVYVSAYLPGRCLSVPSSLPAAILLPEQPFARGNRQIAKTHRRLSAVVQYSTVDTGLPARCLSVPTALPAEIVLPKKAFGRSDCRSEKYFLVVLHQHSAGLPMPRDNSRRSRSRSPNCEYSSLEPGAAQNKNRSAILTSPDRPSFAIIIYTITFLHEQPVCAWQQFQ